MMDFDSKPVQWIASAGLTPYPLAVARMEQRAAEIREGTASELVWLLEHPPLYTAGTGTRIADLKEPDRLPVFPTGRGGQLTYHGPGQRIAYVLLDVQRRFGADVRAFVGALETWIIGTLRDLGIQGETRPGRVGVWVVDERDRGTEKKIAALGVRIRRGVSFHGLSLNVAPDLSHYAGIVPCGIADYGVTSLEALGHPATMNDVDICLKRAFEDAFGPAAEDLKCREIATIGSVSEK